MITFDRVLPELLATCEDGAVASQLGRCCVVRDVRGRVRLVVEPAAAAAPALVSTLQAELARRLGGFFVEPVLATHAGGELGRVAKKLLDQSRTWPPGWPTEVTNLLGAAAPIDHGGKWTGIERTLGKEAWLSTSPPRKPWPLVLGNTPPILTFHSFKGGVGRTTLVAAHAVRLAAEQRRVAVLDLDLEAPGVGALFGVTCERGVLDLLVDHVATGRIELEGASSTVAIGAAPAAEITVFPAGRLDEAYLHKLARLDFTSADPIAAENPVGAALAALLKVLKSRFDVILLDARAGLHDLAGISLHGLAHVDVLVFRGTEQGLLGLEQTIRALGALPETELVLIESQLPNDAEVFERQHTRSRTRAYDALQTHVYEDEDPPQLADVGAAHDVIPVRRKEWLDGLDGVAGRVADILADAELAAVSRRLEAACRLAGGDAAEELA